MTCPRPCFPAARIRSLFIALLCLPLLVACGFNLRGDLNLSPEWNELHLATTNPNSELSSALRGSLENAGVNWRSRAEANYVLQLGEERFQRRNLTIGGNARAAEFELTLTTQLRVTDRNGVELMPRTVVETRKIMTHDPENVTGKVEESRLLRREMRADLVQQLLRKLRILAGTSTSPQAA